MLHICHAAPNTIHTVIIYVAVGDIAYPPLHCFHILSISRALSDDYFDDDVFARCMPYDDLVETRTWGVLEPNMIARVHHDRPDARLAVAVKRNSALVHIHTKKNKTYIVWESVLDDAQLDEPFPASGFDVPTTGHTSLFVQSEFRTENGQTADIGEIV